MIFNGRQRADFGVSIICSVLAVVVVAFRFWARAIKQISWRASDYTIALSTVILLSNQSPDQPVIDKMSLAVHDRVCLRGFIWQRTRSWAAY